MQSSNIPSKIPLPFAYSASGSYINTIPTASQIGIVNGKASLTDGFPPLTFSPISAGGVPPFGADFNGILNEITSIQQWQEAGGFFPFDATFATTIGGYPKGAILQSSTFNGLWVSTIENNSNNPDTTGTGWVSFAFEGIQNIAMSSTTVTLTNLQSAYPILNITGTLTANSTLIVPALAAEWIIVNNTTGGSYTLTVKTASGTGVALTRAASTYTFCDGINVYYANSASVVSFNGRSGFVSLNATDVTSALGYTPIPNTQKFGFGITGEYWHDVFASRALSVVYTNSHGYPIFVNVNGGGNAEMDAYVNSGSSGWVLVAQSRFTITETNTAVTFIVPTGGSYIVNAGDGMYAWTELY